MSDEPSPAITLEKLTEIELPKLVIVRESLYGVAGGTLSDGQELEVHFKKESPVVTMKMSGSNYTVPVNSSFKFSYLYNPHNNLIKAREGYVFKTVGDLMKAVPLPNIVYVGKECKSADKKRTIKKGQILHVKNTGSQLGTGKLLLQCCIISESEDIYLKESCEGQFNTKESLLLFPLPVLLNIKLQWPIVTSMYDSKGIHNEKDVIRLYNEVSIMKSLITSFPEDNHLTEIRTTLPFDVHIAKVSESDMFRLYQKTFTLAQVLIPDMVKTVIGDASPIENSTQTSLLSPLNNKQWIREVNLAVTKPKVHQQPPLPLRLFRPPLTPQLPKKHDHFVFSKTTANDKGLILGPPLTPPLPKKQNQFFSFNYSRADDTNTPTYDSPFISSQLPDPPFTEMTAESNGPICGPPLTPQLPTKQSHPSSFKIIADDDGYSFVGPRTTHRPYSKTTGNPAYGVFKPVDSDLTCNTTDYKNYMLRSRANKPKKKEENYAITTAAIPAKTTKPYLAFNKKVLSKYTIPEVVNLLGIMGLIQYAQKFEEEFITGKILFDLNDEILKEELGMTKKLHRLRLMMIIEGTQSISEYIKDIQFV